MFNIHAGFVVITNKNTDRKILNSIKNSYSPCWGKKKTTLECQELLWKSLPTNMSESVKPVGAELFSSGVRSQLYRITFLWLDTDLQGGNI